MHLTPSNVSFTLDIQAHCYYGEINLACEGSIAYMGTMSHSAALQIILFLVVSSPPIIPSCSIQKNAPRAKDSCGSDNMNAAAYRPGVFFFFFFAEDPVLGLEREGFIGGEDLIPYLKLAIFHL